MEGNLLQAMIEIVFKGNLIYLSPLLFLLMVVTFSDSLIKLIVSAFESGGSRRRTR